MNIEAQNAVLNRLRTAEKHFARYHRDGRGG
jgi:hypothetical protein